MPDPAEQSFWDNETDKHSIINDIAVAITRSIELDVVLQAALNKTMEVFKVGSGALYLLDFKTDRLIIKVHRGLTPAFLTEKSVVSPGSGCAGWAVDHNEMFCAFDRPESQFVCEDAHRLMGIDCLVAVPIATRRRIHGVIELFASTARRLTKQEAVLVKTISDQIGIAVENARLYEESRENVLRLTELQTELQSTNKRLQTHLARETHVAEILQKSLLPRRLPRLRGLEISARLISATKIADVGGDFYDLVELDNRRLALVIGDVCGSGVEVATLTSMAKYTVRAFTLENQDIAAIMTRANRVMCKQLDPFKFIALFVGIIDLSVNRLEYCVAGQPVPLLAKSKTELIELTAGGTAIGVDKDSEYRSSSIELRPQDTLLVFTDGLVEARRNQELFGPDSVAAILLKVSQEPLETVVNTILAAAGDFGGNVFRDDVVIVSLRLRKQGGE